MRPHRNPRGVAANIAANQQYLAHQMLLPPALREDDAGFDAAWNLDNWEGWREEQPNDWFGGFNNLPTIWGGPNGDLDEVNRFLADQGQIREPHIRLRQPPGAPLGEPVNGLALFKKFKALNLDKLKPGDPVIRDVRLPPFHIDYDSYEQINTKLNGTVIMIKDNPFFVSGVYDLNDGTFGLKVVDGAGGSYGILYEDVADCRPIAPGYVTKNSSVYWLYRGPERQNQQGMNHRNTFIKTVNSSMVQGARSDFLLAALANRKDMRYEPVLATMILQGAVNHLRLSNNVAIFNANKKGAPIGVEYMGRNFGLIVGGTVKVFDENDLRPSWIHKDLNAVNLVVRA